MGPGRKHALFRKEQKQLSEAVVKGLRVISGIFTNCYYFKIKPWKCLLINLINNNISLGVD